MKYAMDLFCGLGGWTMGAERTGAVEVRVALNHDPRALEAHSSAHPHVQHWQQAAEEFPFEVLRDHLGGQWLLASPVCKDDSSCGKPAARGTGGNGIVDLAALVAQRASNRNTAWSVITAVGALAPEVVLVENVPGFLKRPTYPAWRLALESLGYQVREHVLNAADYGAATDRPRAIITASRGRVIDLAPTWGTARRVVADCLDPDDHPGNRWADVEAKPPRTRDLIRTKQREAGLRRGILNNVGDGVRMRRVDELAPTFTTKTLTQLMLVDGDRVRILNPAEGARIMGWRDDEVDLSGFTRGDASLLVGNAIPVDLAQGVVAQAVAA
ncbi:MAG TPA: DNA cytosine methyltransferase [Gammaproteobacteria bacterium]|nr:DNA cytosine methyltransferase [Gammaproteobacteria bacterium]